jgi:cell wall-associated NlpC family hydrolase
MESGILIYRDARIRPEYPVREIPREQMKKGDLIFFPGHVAIYDENGQYVHATGWKGTPWVTVNSLNPASERYRPDLAEKIIAVGSVF